jgi:hypothetical protein
MNKINLKIKNNLIQPNLCLKLNQPRKKKENEINLC